MTEYAKQRKAAYDIDYAKKNLIRKLIPFNRNDEEDVAMLSWLDSQPNVTQYIKRLIWEDMVGVKETIFWNNGGIRSQNGSQEKSERSGTVEE